MESGNTLPRNAHRTPVKILIIDDERETLDLLTFELGRHGYTVVTARDGQEGLEKVKSDKLSLVICDIRMLRMSGPDALSRFREIDPGLEIIMATGFSTIDAAVECMKRGAYDFVCKPFNVEELLSRIEKAVEKRRLSSEVVSLTELHRLKSEFLATISHELRTPMHAILGYTSLMIDRAYGDLTEKQHTALKRISVNAAGLLQTINNILDISKLSSEKVSLFLEDFSLAEVLQEVTGMMEPLAGEKNIYLRFSPGQDIMLFSDRTRLKQVLINVIGNAIKFTKKGGVTVTAARALPAAGANPAGQDMVRIDVTDTGIGIRPEALQTIFEEFRQADPATAREYGGTGLGLAISRKLAHLMGGALVVKSTPESGSTFTLTLPRRQTGSVPETDPSLAIPAPAPGNDKKILLAIDDDPETHKLLRDGLEGTAFTLASALNGDEGIALARHLQPFAIALDVLMPRKDGWTVLQSLKDSPDLWSIPVIMMSIADNRNLAFSLGVSDYILKPFDRRTLLGRLERLAAIKNRQVLIADDDKELNMVIQMSLTNLGYRVISAYGGEEALVSIEQDKPDIVLLDLNMPGVSGFDVLETLRGRKLPPPLRVIALTDIDLTRTEAEDVRACAEAVIDKGSSSIKETLSLIKSTLEAEPRRPG